MPSIDENNLYANLYVETSPVQATASWTNHIATVRDIRLTRGGIEPFIGINNVEPGAGTITLVDNTATINPGYWIRIKYSSSIIWAGYIQDVNRTYSNVNGVMYEYKTLTVLDWVAWVAQFTVSGLAPVSKYFSRNQDLNAILPGTPISPATGTITAPYQYLDSLYSLRNMNEVLDLMANSTAGGFWRSQLVAPTGTGYLDLVLNGVSITADDVALTDGTHTGTPNNLTYYTDIEVGTKTSQVVNNVEISNTFGVNGTDATVTYVKSDSTSVNLYGSRYASTEANARITVSALNLFENPSFEEPGKEATDASFYYSIEQPALDSAGVWAAYNGSYASRSYCNVAALTVANPVDERVPVTAGTTYYGFAYGANSGTASSRGRFFMQWVNEANAVISTTYGAYVNFTNNRQWYKCTLSQAAPVGAVYCRIGIQHSRSTATNFPVGSKSWTDAMYFGTANETTYWDGNTADTSATLYAWTGEPNMSTSFRATNVLDTLASQFLTDNATAKYSPYRVTVNAQANLTAVQLFNLYESVYVWFKNNRWTSVVTGISHQITINDDGTTRWMIDLDLRPSTATI